MSLSGVERHRRAEDNMAAKYTYMFLQQSRGCLKCHLLMQLLQNDRSRCANVIIRELNASEFEVERLAAAMRGELVFPNSFVPMLEVKKYGEPKQLICHAQPIFNFLAKELGIGGRTQTEETLM